MGPVSPVRIMMMLKIWMLLPVMYSMKHINPTCLAVPVARLMRACRREGKSGEVHFSMGTGMYMHCIV